MKILRYKAGSRSAALLRQKLAPRPILWKKPSTPIRKRRETIINWGNSGPSFSTVGINIINKPEAIRLSSNKLQSLIKMKAAGINVPVFSTSKEEAASWIRDGGKAVIRTILNAHSGRGILVARETSELVQAPLYTRYFKKQNEFRVHIFQGRVIDYAEKKARLNKGPDFDPLIRSNTRGWVFCRDNILNQEEVKREALKAVQVLGLDFGAVDVMWNGAKAVVLEVNTAPGLCDTTASKYAEAIKAANFV